MDEKEEAKEDVKVPVNLTGEAQGGQEHPKFLVPDDVYEARVIEVSDILTTPTFENKNIREEKFIVNFEFPVPRPDGEGKPNPVLAYWVRPKISKGQGRYSDSKCYDLMEKFGLLGEFQEAFGEKPTEVGGRALIEFLRPRLLGKEAKVTTTTYNRGTDNEYSGVQTIVRFLGETG